jgi:hypothetical protein
MNTSPTLRELERIFGNRDIPMLPTIRKTVLLYIKATRRRRALKAARTRRRARAS